MDLNTVERVRQPRRRSELVLQPGETFLAGGTWLYSEPQLEVTGLVDLTTLGWPSLTVTDDGLEVAATCTLAELLALEPDPSWRASPLVAACVHSLVASFKIFASATVGGNLCTSLPAGSLIALCAGLDATAVIWTPDGGERTMAVADLVVGAQRNALQRGELLRAVRIGADALRSRTAHRKIALTALGRSGSLVVGRRGEDDTFVLTVTGATDRPYQFRYPSPPAAEALRADLGTVGTWYDDPHGSPAWRAHVTAVLAEQVRDELSTDAG